MLRFGLFGAVRFAPRGFGRKVKLKDPAEPTVPMDLVFDMVSIGLFAMWAGITIFKDAELPMTEKEVNMPKSPCKTP